MVNIKKGTKFICIQDFEPFVPLMDQVDKSTVFEFKKSMINLSGNKMIQLDGDIYYLSLTEHEFNKYFAPMSKAAKELYE